MDKLDVLTKSKYELQDITAALANIVGKSRVSSGILVVFVPHTTAGIICNEAESNLKSDILKVLEALENNSDFFGGFAHDRDEENAHAHIAAALSGNSQSFIIENGKIMLGNWQSIMFLEMDGPRKREIWTQILKN
ncbi:MAG: secondary thiamine-phosphate synthase enzyme YjbQ [bacterium]|nr:secondary thiamine-phosphate synthase enzyme YjbQ [bacterium]